MPAPHLEAWDHPRIRGEHGHDGVGAPARGGSSPHTRGALLSTCEDCVEHRIIPAYAGSTTSWCPAAAWSSGSSPHTRGARSAPWRTLTSTGIIPAYAGSTYGPPRSDARRADHPRIRGEHAPTARARGRATGSSPHTRGALAGGHVVGGGVRIIPAYAGSTLSGVSLGSLSPDHPRIRGEHAPLVAGSLAPVGSSPHTRGARHERLEGSFFTWIIPAYAGSTARGVGC